MYTENEDNEAANQRIFPVWSFWKTLAISAFILVIGNVLVQVLVLAIHMATEMYKIQNFSLDLRVLQAYAGNLFQKSSAVSQTILISDLFSVLLIIYFVRRKTPLNMKGYLGFNPVKPLPFMMWQVIMVAFFFGMNYIVSQTSVEEPEFMKFMRDMLATESLAALIMMLLALVGAAPLFEEMLFRGFMYTGMLYSSLGIIGAICIPSLFWSLIHVQYEWIWIAMIFFTGIMFTLARHLTGSIYTVIAMHAINNFLSFVDILKK